MWQIGNKLPSIEDDRGYLVEFELDNWQQANVLFSKKGVIRGCHYHKFTKELFYLIEGALFLELKCVETGAKYTEELSMGAMFNIPPFTWHKLIFLADTHLMTFYNVKFDPSNPDIYQI